MDKVTLNYRDLYNAVLNNQDKLRGTAEEEIDSKFDYLILGVYGATTSNVVTIKDKDDNVLFTVSRDMGFSFPPRISGGLKMTVTSASTVYFGRIRNNEQ